MSVAEVEHREEVCAVCHEPLGTENLLALKCRHQFHIGCVADWLVEHATCPMCRKQHGRDRHQHLSPYFCETMLSLSESLLWAYNFARLLLAGASAGQWISYVLGSRDGKHDFLQHPVALVMSWLYIVFGLKWLVASFRTHRYLHEVAEPFYANLSRYEWRILVCCTSSWALQMYGPWEPSLYFALYVAQSAAELWLWHSFASQWPDAYFPFDWNRVGGVVFVVAAMRVFLPQS
jgi:hypothetical protein